MNYNNQNYSVPNLEVTDSLSRHTAKTFGWMFLGLLLTFVIATGFYFSGFVWYIYSIPFASIGLLIVEVALVIYLSARIEKISSITAKILFFTYAAVNGIVFSYYFFLFDLGILILIFGATAVFFGMMALIGYFTKTNFSSLKPFLFGGLVFLAIFWVFSLFIRMPGFETIICTIGIVIFLGFTAYDTQKIKEMHQRFSHNSELLQKGSIMSALALYLDFVNLFLYILRFVGRSRN